jgi:hypothetical protein
MIFFHFKNKLKFYLNFFSEVIHEYKVENLDVDYICNPLKMMKIRITLWSGWIQMLTGRMTEKIKF